MINLRDERPSDVRAIHDLVFEAFGRRNVEPSIIELARHRGQMTYSVVAETEGKIVGHIMVSPVTLEPDAGPRCVAIGPIAVAPEQQVRGIGSKLMREVIDRAKEDSYDAILLLGNPRFYHRFGFATAPVRNEYGAVEEFMALQLTPGSLDRVGSKCVARYIGAFADAESE
jgi:putative acetyltransferase